MSHDGSDREHHDHHHEHNHHDHDHHHDHDIPDPATLELIEGLEYHTLRSVGIDIGSSTSHFVVSRLVIRRLGSSLSAEFVVSEREILYRSPVWLTPYTDGTELIDTDRLGSLLRQAYTDASFQREDIDTGAVVITGEAMKKRNAERIASIMADWSGAFVCVSAGPNHEAQLAAHGSGAMALSESHRGTVVNVDIGGGTTKVSVIDNGSITHIEVFSVGARLLAFDPDGRICRLESPVRTLLAELGLDVGVGDPLSADDRQRVADLMAEVVCDTLLGGTLQSGTDHHGRARREALLVSTDGRPMPPADTVEHLVISGGVSEYLADATVESYGDLGAELGAALTRRLAALGLAEKVRPGSQRIRATVLGASQYSVQASGQTVFVSDIGTLPVRGLRALPVDMRPGASEQALREAMHRNDLDSWNSRLAVVIALTTPTTYQHLRRIAAAVIAVAGEHNPLGPLHIVLRDDLARSLGGILTDDLGWRGPVVVVDGITVNDLDHVDIGTPIGKTGALPVTVTSLEFPSAPTAMPDLPRPSFPARRSENP